MNGKQMLKALERYRAEVKKAIADGEDVPVIEAAFPLDAQKRIRRQHGDVPANLLEAINDAVEELNDAQNDFDELLETLEYIAVGLANADQLSRTVERMQTPDEISVGAADEVDSEGALNPDRADNKPGGGE